jgi:hypothetical protein
VSKKQSPFDDAVYDMSTVKNSAEETIDGQGEQKEWTLT